MLYVSYVQAAADFYPDKLGFRIDFLHGQPAFYASVSRDEACIHLHRFRPGWKRSLLRRLTSSQGFWSHGRARRWNYSAHRRL